MPKIFHIRRPQQKTGPRRKATLCGAAPTSHDNSYSWQVYPVTGQYVLCEQCEAMRAGMRAN